jgi:hypothetical protein
MDTTRYFYKPIQSQFRITASSICRSTLSDNSHLKARTQLQPQSPLHSSLFIEPIRPSNPRPKPQRTFVVTAKPLNELSDKRLNRKSSAQVEIGVTPPRSCELKLGREKRRNPLTVRLSDNDREQIREKAQSAGCSLNAYVRASMLGSDYKPPADPALTEALRKLNFELTKQGTDINQVARQLNAGLISPDQAESMMVMLTRSTMQIHKSIREAMAQGKMED